MVPSEEESTVKDVNLTTGSEDPAKLLLEVVFRSVERFEPTETS